MPVISGNELHRFRRRAGDRVRSLVRAHGSLLVGLPVGVGKSFNIDIVVEEAVEAGDYDLIVVLAPTRAIINERRFVTNPPEDVLIANLKPRPADLCGGVANALWSKVEKQGMGAFGRVNICADCPNKEVCYWPEQYGSSLQGVQVVFATQTHLERDPDFIYQLVTWSGHDPGRVLVILDEADAIAKPRRRSIRSEDLSRFHEVLERLAAESSKKIPGRWLYLSNLLLMVGNSDLRCHQWRFPRLFPPQILAIQTEGHRRFGEEFHYIGYDLGSLGRSAVDSREVTPSGDICYTAVSNFPGDVILYSGTVGPEFARYRLGEHFHVAFPDHQFSHPDTVWYNIASRIGAARYFETNRPQILGFYAKLIARRIEEGKRVLLVAKKRFVPSVAADLQERLHDLGIASAHILTHDFSAAKMEQPGVVPIINYGVIGVNDFQEFDCAFCVTSYYVNEAAVSETLQDAIDSESRIPLEIKICGQPLRRVVQPENAADRFYDVSQVAQHALQYLEMGAVVQAVGRVRPFTKPREVITFQCGAPNDFAYTREFGTLAEAREFFDLPTERDRQRQNSKAKVFEAKLSGLTQVAAAEYTGLGLRTVQRHWN